MRKSAVKMSGFFSRHSNVYIYVPNLIGKLRHMVSHRFECELNVSRGLGCAGYARVAAALYAFAVAFTSPFQCVAAYFLSFVCDELDGRFARMFNQTSTFGAVLDMVTDRCGFSRPRRARRLCWSEPQARPRAVSSLLITVMDVCWHGVVSAPATETRSCVRACIGVFARSQ